jgi:hypothetical protein
MADLRNGKFENGEIPSSLIDKGNSMLNEPFDPALSPEKWKKVDTLEIFLIDYWNSSFVRFFTPVPEPVQAMKATISLNSTNIKVEFTDGKSRGKILGIENGEGYIIDKELGKVYSKESDLKLYLESLRLYILLPFIAHKFEKIYFMGEMGIGERNYSEIFATNGSWTPSKEFDQYKFLIRNDSGSIEFVQFTYREVFDSYKGVLHYEDYTNLNGRLVPLKISIKDGLVDESFIHQLQIGTIKFFDSNLIPIQ